LVWTDLAGQRSIGVCECGAHVWVNGDNAFQPVVSYDTEKPHIVVQMRREDEVIRERKKLMVTPHPTIIVPEKPGPGERPPITFDFAQRQAASTQWRKKKK
jgi:hypothetical protein